MDSNDSLRIVQEEVLQQAVMKRVLANLQDTPYILKGGAALMYTRSLDRHTTDLDFDSEIALNIKNRIRKGLKAAGVEVKSLKVVKNTATVQRVKVHYKDLNTGNNVLFKVETSFRKIPNAEHIEVVQGIRTYDISELFEQKLKATEGRIQARDLYDITHILQNYVESLSLEQINRIDVFSRDIDALVDRYLESFQTDDVLMRLTDAEETVLKLRESIEQHLSKQELHSTAQPQFLSSHTQQKATKFLKRYMDESIKALISNMEKAGCVVTNNDGSKSFESSAFSWNLTPNGTTTITRLSDGVKISPQSVTAIEMNAIKDFIIKIQEKYIVKQNNNEDISGPNQKPPKPPNKPKL